MSTKNAERGRKEKHISLERERGRGGGFVAFMVRRVLWQISRYAAGLSFLFSLRSVVSLFPALLLSLVLDFY